MMFFSSIRAKDILDKLFLRTNEVLGQIVFVDKFCFKTNDVLGQMIIGQMTIG